MPSTPVDPTHRRPSTPGATPLQGVALTIESPSSRRKGSPTLQGISQWARRKSAELSELSRASSGSSRGSPEKVPQTPGLKLSKLNKMATQKMKRSCKSRTSQITLMARGARRQLQPFANAPRPTGRCCTSSAWFHALFIIAQPLFGVVLRDKGFYATLARAGGESRVRMLLKVALFDANEDGDIDEEELVNYERLANELVEVANATLQNFSVVGSLLFGATFLAVIGRPTPWEPSPESINLFGDHLSFTFMWIAYGLSCLMTVFTLTSIIYSVGSRYMLMYILATLESKLCLLCELNPVAVVSRLFIMVVLLLFLLLAFGGLLAVGEVRARPPNILRRDLTHCLGPATALPLRGPLRGRLCTASAHCLCALPLRTASLPPSDRR